MKTKKMQWAVLSLLIVLGTVANTIAERNIYTKVLLKASFTWAVEQNGALVNTDTYDFGAIPLAQPVMATFIVTNTGNSPLILSQVQASCGCTVTEYTQTPIAPGKTGKVTAVYNAAYTGMFHKSITVTTNAVEESTKTLYIKGEVRNQ
ncbi:MAG: DUF1573 domain-containing protein [Cytophagales bacterium]|nr:MAG: DUF1573 domain-containing protein [Cytophagales bacterium]